MRCFITVPLAGAILLLLLTCTNPFAPAQLENSGETGLLTDQLSPDEVLANFLYAYTFRDSLVYSELFDSSFTFVSWDFGVTPPEPINWGRDRELRVAGRMFRFFDTIDLTWDSRTPIATDSLDNEPVRVEEKLTFTLTLDGGTTIPTLIGEVTFVFVRREEDDRWVIIRWEDLRI